MSLNWSVAQVRRSTATISRRFGSLLSLRDLNNLLRLSLGRALWGFIDRDLPKRWDPQYVGRLGYTGKGKTPFYKDGALIDNATRARPIVVAKKGGAVGRITIPVGHPMRLVDIQAFRSIPPEEARAVALDMWRCARAIIRGSPPPVPVGGARGAAALRQRLSRDAMIEAKRYSRSTVQAFNAAGFDRLGGIAARLSQRRRMGRGRNKGIHLGDAAPPGSTVPAIGRRVTMRNANARYRASARGKRVRAAWRSFHRREERRQLRPGIMAHPERFHRNTLRAYGIA